MKSRTCEGGARELTRLIVFDLLRRGFLHAEGSRRLEWAQYPRPKDKLSHLEGHVFSFFSTARRPRELFQRGELATRVRADCEPLEKALQEEGLLSSTEQYRRAWEVGLSAAVLILALGGLKLAVAVSQGRHNVGFLVVIAVVGLVVLAACCRVPRLSRRGQEYLSRLQIGLAGLRTPHASAIAGESDADLLLASALFGVGVLGGTPYGYVPEMFPTGASSGSCGGGCGAGCGGGGGCGGGCGGCGGCGG